MVWDLKKDAFFNNAVLTYPKKTSKDTAGNLWTTVAIESPIFYKSTDADFNYDQGLDLRMPERLTFFSKENIEYLRNRVAEMGWPKPEAGHLHGYMAEVYVKYIRYDQYVQFKPSYNIKDKIVEMNERTLKEYTKEMAAEKDLYNVYMTCQFSGYFDDPDRQFTMTNPGRRSRREGLFKMPFDDRLDDELRERYIGKRSNLDWLAVDPTHVYNRINF